MIKYIHIETNMWCMGLHCPLLAKGGTPDKRSQTAHMSALNEQLRIRTRTTFINQLSMNNFTTEGYHTVPLTR